MSDSEIDDNELARGWASTVRAVSAVQHSAAEDIEALGIPFAYFSVLSLLLEVDDHRLPMSRIARDLSMTSGGFTKLADRMARDGFIDRRNSAGDRRVVFAALTNQGLEVGRRAEGSYRALLRQRVLKVIEPDQLRLMADLANRVYEANRAIEPDANTWQVKPRPENAPDRRQRRSDERPSDNGPDRRQRRSDEAPSDNEPDRRQRRSDEPPSDNGQDTRQRRTDGQPPSEA